MLLRSHKSAVLCHYPLHAEIHEKPLLHLRLTPPLRRLLSFLAELRPFIWDAIELLHVFSSQTRAKHRKARVNQYANRFSFLRSRQVCYTNYSSMQILHGILHDDHLPRTMRGTSVTVSERLASLIWRTAGVEFFAKKLNSSFGERSVADWARVWVLTASPNALQLTAALAGALARLTDFCSQCRNFLLLFQPSAEVSWYLLLLLRSHISTKLSCQYISSALLVTQDAYLMSST